MDNEQPNTNNYSTNTGNNHAFTYFSTVSFAGANFTQPIRGLSPTAESVTGMGGESTGMGETDSNGVGDDTDNTDEYVDEWDGIYVNPHDDLCAAYNAYAMAEGIDTQMAGKRVQQRIADIKAMSIRIAYDCIKEIFQYRFPKKEE